MTRGKSICFLENYFKKSPVKLRHRAKTRIFEGFLLCMSTNIFLFVCVFVHGEQNAFPPQEFKLVMRKRSNV